MRGGGGEWLGFGKETGDGDGEWIGFEAGDGGGEWLGFEAGDGDGEWRPAEPEEPAPADPYEPWSSAAGACVGSNPGRSSSPGQCSRRHAA